MFHLAPFLFRRCVASAVCSLGDKRPADAIAAGASIMQDAGPVVNGTRAREKMLTTPTPLMSKLATSCKGGARHIPHALFHGVFSQRVEHREYIAGGVFT